MNMQLKIRCFGIAKDITGLTELKLELVEGADVNELKSVLLERYPAFGDLVSFSIAVNNEYVRDNPKLKESDEVAIIPPVSGG